MADQSVGEEDVKKLTDKLNDQSISDLGAKEAKLSMNNNNGDCNGEPTEKKSFQDGFASNTGESASPNGHMSSRQFEPHSQLLATLDLPPNVTPETSEAIELVEQVRVKFLARLGHDDDAEREDYDAEDLQQLKETLPPADECLQSLAFRLIAQFLRFDSLLNCDDVKQVESKVNEAVESLHEMLKFRKRYQLSRISADQFSKEFFILSEMFAFGHDRQGLPLLYFRFRVHRRWSNKLADTLRRYFAWQVNEITKTYQGARVQKFIDREGRVRDGSFALCFVCSSASYSCVDLDLFRFLVCLLINHYPAYCRYTICVDLGYLFRSIFKLVKSWLPEETRDCIHLVSSQELAEFVHPDQIPNCIRSVSGSLDAREVPDQNRLKMPENFDSLRDADALAKDLGISAKELGQFKSHVEKIRAEMDQLNAI